MKSFIDGNQKRLCILICLPSRAGSAYVGLSGYYVDTCVFVGGGMMAAGHSMYNAGPDTLPAPINWYSAGAAPVAAQPQAQLATHPHMGTPAGMHLQSAVPRTMAGSYPPGVVPGAAPPYSLQQQQQQQIQNQQNRQRMAAHLGARSNLQNLIHARQAQAVRLIGYFEVYSIQ